MYTRAFIATCVVMVIVNYKFYIKMYNKLIKKLKSSLKKEVKITNKNMLTGKIVNSVDIINSIINEPILKDGKETGQFKAVALPAQLSFKFALLLKEIDPIVVAFNKVKNEKILELGTEIMKDKKGTGQYSFHDKEGKLTENGKKYQEELEKLGKEEVNIKIPEIKIAELKDIKIETGKLIVLDWLIKQ